MVTIRLTPPKKIVFRLSLILGIVALVFFAFAVILSYHIFTGGFFDIPLIEWFVMTLAFHIMLFAFGLICAGVAFKGF
ncbi:MAG: hypothetical protein ACFFCO_10860 [Promethearchaeota archaeon]